MPRSEKILDTLQKENNYLQRITLYVEWRVSFRDIWNSCAIVYKNNDVINMQEYDGFFFIQTLLIIYLILFYMRALDIYSLNFYIHHF